MLFPYLFKPGNQARTKFVNKENVAVVEMTSA